MSNFLLCTTSLMAGNRTRVVLSEPLHGGSLERSVTRPLKLQERRKGSSITGVNHGNVPPQGFSEDHPGPATSQFISLGCMVTLCSMRRAIRLMARGRRTGCCQE